ncbi:MAG: gamma-glutamyl-phosphate reductase, partial [Paracoccaceae bacterium]|nr:gamma-glutamyl-phosphate reductase [Paracoccaceae bacterium]
MTQSQDLTAQMNDIGRRARAAAAELAFAPSDAKARALMAAADAIEAQTDAIIAANARDLDYGRDKGLSPAMMDRLMLDASRIMSIAAGLRAVAAQDDPVGR